jgi:hypothetical protein
MTQLRSFDDHSLFEIKNVLFTEQVQPARASAELLIEELIVVGLPGDFNDVEVSRKSHLPADSAEIFAFHRLALDALTDAVKRIGELPEAVIRPAGGFDLVSGTGR